MVHVCTLVLKLPGFFTVVKADQISKLLKPRKTADIFLEEMQASLSLLIKAYLKYH